jgi:hypothetical protein
MNKAYCQQMLDSFWTFLKKVVKNIEWPIIIGIWGFFTLVIIAIDKSYSFFFVGIFTVIGIFLTMLAAYNSYRQKSTALIDKYEEIFFGERMEKKRKSAARFLLGEGVEGSLDLEDVLDFFEAPLAQKINSGEIDGFQAYSYFYYWIRLYWQASQEYINNYRKEDELCAWGSLKGLYEKMSNYEKAEIKRDGGKEYKDDDLVLSPEKLQIYLRKEARQFNVKRKVNQ